MKLNDMNFIHCIYFSYVDKQTKKGYTSRVAFQVLIAPDIYEVGAETIGARHRSVTMSLSGPQSSEAASSFTGYLFASKKHINESSQRPDTVSSTSMISLIFCKNVTTLVRSNRSYARFLDVFRYGLVYQNTSMTS